MRGEEGRGEGGKLGINTETKREIERPVVEKRPVSTPAEEERQQECGR